MFSNEELEKYMASIPPIPAILKECKEALGEGDLIKAADLVSKDKALMFYFQNIVNKPIFGFSKKLTNARQIFGVLGIIRVKQLFQTYYISLITPKQWEIFKINTNIFQEIQVSFIIKWEIILKQHDLLNDKMSSIVTLIPAAIAVCEEIFKAHKDDVLLIKSQKNISYEQLLYKMSGHNFFELVKQIAIKWEFSQDIVELLNILITKQIQNDENGNMMLYLLLLINYEMSRKIYLDSGLNDLFEIEYDFDEVLVEDFFQMMSVI